MIPFSIIYLIINFFKKKFFLNKKINTIPVIVVGNLTVGGTGKTSLVIWLCNYLSDRKYNIGVITGGYKTANANKLQIVKEDSYANEVGDEAILISKKEITRTITIKLNEGADSIDQTVAARKRFSSFLG